jgi:hypothetical protein
VVVRRVVVGLVVLSRVVVSSVVVSRVVVSSVVVSSVVVSSRVVVRVVVGRVVVERVRVRVDDDSEVDSVVVVVEGPGSAGAGTDFPAKKPSTPSTSSRDPASRVGRSLMERPLLCGASLQT